jgi:hypothetical protein
MMRHLSVVSGIALFAVIATALAAASSQDGMSGTIRLNSIGTAKCKSGTGKVRGKKETDIQCYDAGRYAGMPVSGGASYSWVWYSRQGDPVIERGTIAINLGKGDVYLAAQGTVVTIGKVTTSYGKARTTGTWKFHNGNRAYKSATGSGTYTLDVVRNATTYKILKLTINGNLG